MQFSRVTIFFTGILFIFFLFFLNRIQIYHHSKFTHGILILDKEDPDYFKYVDKPMILHYYVGMKEYYRKISGDEKEANREVKVIYNPKKPYEGKVYTVRQFWFVTMFWLIAPVMLWIAFIFSFIEEGGKIEVRFKKAKNIGNKLHKRK